MPSPEMPDQPVESLANSERNPAPGAGPEPARTIITWKPSGPLIVEGPVEIRDNSGHPLVPPPQKIPGQVKLCACGLSKDRPFCDGSHKR